MKVVSVLTASIPERAELLEQCQASVARQHFAHEHLIAVDWEREGAAVIRNRLAIEAAGPWLLVLDDDDLLVSAHALTYLLAYAQDADVVYSRPQLEGLEPEQQADFLGEPPAIPVTALVRASLWRQLGGMRPYEQTDIFADRDLWTRALKAGARFRLCPIDGLWSYRFHGANQLLQH